MARKDGAVSEQNTSAETTQETKAAPPPRVASKYVLTDKKREKELRGQAAEVQKALEAQAGVPATVEELAAKCTFAGSRQDKGRVAGYYIAQFKKEGFVKVSDAPAGEQAAS
jgi:hypothetical protein